MRLLVFILGFVFFISNTYAQRKLVIYGKLTEEDSSATIYNANVSIENTSFKTVSNRYGNYTLEVTTTKNLDMVLVVKDFRYDLKKHKITWREISRAKNDSIRVDLALVFHELKEVSVSTAQTVYGSKKHNVSDFEFAGNKIVLLTYEKKLEKGTRLLLCDESMKVYQDILVPGVAKELHRDFHGGIHLLCEDKVYDVNVYDTVMGLVLVEKQFFMDYIKPLVDTNNNHVYFSNYLDIYPAFDYLAYNQNDSSYKKLRHLIDQPLMDLYRAQYKYVNGKDKLEAYRAEIRTGIDKEIWIAIWSGFPQSIYYKPLYAPMFLKEDTVLIFDHYTNRLFRFNKNNEVIDSIEIDYHLGKTGKEWEEQLVKDYTNETIYGIFQRAGKFYLKELSTQTGEILRVISLHYRYVEKIKIINDYVYYIYRPFESSQNKYLYKEHIGK